MATTINGTLLNVEGDPLAHTRVKFKPLSGATVLGDDVCIPVSVVAKTDADGVLAVDLMPGDYEVWTGSTKQFQIEVADGGPFDLEDIIVEELAYVPSGTNRDAIKLQGFPISENDPASGNELVWNGTYWTPTRRPKILINSFADAGNVSDTETDLSICDLDAGLFSTNGDRLVAKYNGILTVSGSTKTLKVYFYGNYMAEAIWINTTDYSVFEVQVEIVRVSASVLRFATHVFFRKLNSVAIDYVASYNGQFSGFTAPDFTASLRLKMTGKSSVTSYADNDVVLKFAGATFFPSV